MRTLKAFVKICVAYWWHRDKWREWILLAATIGCSLAFVRVSVAINSWHKAFYDALASFDSGSFVDLMLQYLTYLGMIVGCIAAGNWLGKVTVFRWRESLTKDMQTAWLDNHRHYRLLLEGEPDNPDQRIAEDIARLAEDSIYLFKYFIMNLARLVAFVAVLWELSGVQTFMVANITIVIHGYLVWIALAYSIVSTALIHLIGRSLQSLNINRQHREADYRATLLRVHDHSEQIAFYRGEPAENGRLNRYFLRIRKNWFALIAREFKVEVFSSAQMRVAWFLPIAATLPLYLEKAISLGGMMQAQSAFSNVLEGFGWFLNYYRRIIEWSATVRRVADFRSALDDVAPASLADGVAKAGHPRLVLSALEVHSPSGVTLLDGIDLDMTAPAWLLIDGDSGVGKSTLLRVLAGLWPHYRGHYSVQGTSLFLPQTPYLPNDTLRSVLSYPSDRHAEDKEIAWALEVVGMHRLFPSLDQQSDWSRILSGGEQQRLAIVNALLHKPDVLFLDEMTNQLDARTAVELTRLLKWHLPNTLVVGISHQPEIKAEFDKRLSLASSQISG